MFGIFKKRKSSKSKPPEKRTIRAKYDAAQTSAENQEHWANADSLGPNAATNPLVRATLRNRSRYEIANNTYAKGIIKTKANDVIGTGPRLQMLTQDEDANEWIEKEFMQWARKIKLARKLRVMRKAFDGDGETFAIFIKNSKVSGPVKLDLRVYEADQCTTPGQILLEQDDNSTDGIEYDAVGNPQYYYFLAKHPGGEGVSLKKQYRKINADGVIHWYDEERAGQKRGIPSTTPALPLFAQMRRYTLAVLAAAETAADFAAVLFTDSPAGGEAQSDIEPMDVVELEKRMATTLPDGWKLGQIKAEQPATTYSEFKREILNEIARGELMPFNKAAGNSSGYNYSSGRLDHQDYYKSNRIDQDDCEIMVLDRVFEMWMYLAVRIQNYMPQSLRLLEWDHQWFWDGPEHTDPQREAKAQETYLENSTTTLADEWARKGQDWIKKIKQRVREKLIGEQEEKQLRKKMGLEKNESSNVEETPKKESPDKSGR